MPSSNRRLSRLPSGSGRPSTSPRSRSTTKSPRAPPRATLDGSQLRERLAQLLDGAIDVGVGDLSARTLDRRDRSCCRPRSRGKTSIVARVAQRLPGLDALRDDLGRADAASRALLHGVRIRVLDQMDRARRARTWSPKMLLDTERGARPGRKPVSLACVCTRPNARSNSAVTSLDRHLHRRACVELAFTSIDAHLHSLLVSRAERPDSHVREGGLEPPPVARQILSLVRLPVPPLSLLANLMTYVAHASLSSARVSKESPRKPRAWRRQRWTADRHGGRILGASQDPDSI